MTVADLNFMPSIHIDGVCHRENEAGITISKLYLSVLSMNNSDFSITKIVIISSLGG